MSDSATSERRNYHTLDGLRGIAAISIVVLHTSRFFGDWKLPSSFLAVDLFFALSGFVLASAYEKRFLAGMSALDFFRIRFIRLYPLYALGTFIGIPVALAAMKFPGLSVQWNSTLLATSLPFSFLMLPTPRLGVSDVIYPFNPVLWSIFFEMLINMIYVSFIRALSNAALLTTIAIAAILLVIYGFDVQTLDVGYSWAGFPGGLLRVLFSFTAGILVFRWFGGGARYRSSLVAASFVLCVPLVFAVQQNIIFELAIVTLVFPALIAVASHVDPGVGLQKWFSAIGVASYAIYALHKPIYQLLLAILKMTLPLGPEYLTPWLGIAYVVALVFFCIWIDSVYDKPVRRFLSKRTAPRDGRGQGRTALKGSVALSD